MMGPLMRGLLLAALALAITVSAASSQGPEEVRIQQIDATGYPRVLAILEVVDEKGLPVQGLTGPQIRVFEQGTLVASPQLAPAQQAGVGIGVVLALDVSGSMVGAPLDAAKRAAGAFIDALGDADEVAIVSFANQVRLVQGFTRSKGEAKQNVGSLVAVGNTKLNDGLYLAAELAAQSALRRKVVVLVTDGRDTASDRSADAGLTLAVERGVVVSAVGLGDVDQTYLQRLANVTAGIALFTSVPSELGAAYGVLATRLRSAYLLEYRAPRQVAPTERVLRVEVGQGNQVRRGERAFRVELAPLQVRLTGLGGSQAQQTVLAVEVDRPELVAEVHLEVDGQTQRPISEPPFTFGLSPGALQEGVHTVEAVVADVTGRETRARADFAVAPSSAVRPVEPAPAPSASPWWVVAWGAVRGNLVAQVALVALPASLAALVGHVLSYRWGRTCFSCGQRLGGQEACRACQTRVYAQSQPLGQILVRGGALSTEQLETALKASETQGRRLGEVLLASSPTITAQELRTALRIQDRTTGLALRFQRLLSESEAGLSFRAGVVVYGTAVFLSLLLLVAPAYIRV